MQEKRIHQIFAVSVSLKGLHAIFEIVGGFALYLTSTATILGWIDRSLRDEISQEPQRLDRNHLCKFGQTFSVAQHDFFAFYLLSHGIVKVVLVYGLLKEKLWAYPASFVVFGAFIAYQLYRYSFTHERRPHPAQHLRYLRDRPCCPRIPAFETSPSHPLICPIGPLQCSGSPSPAASPIISRGASSRSAISTDFHLGHQAVVEPGGRACLPRAAAGHRRDLRSSPGPVLQAGCAAVPPDDARSARAAVRACGRRRDAGVRVRGRARLNGRRGVRRRCARRTDRRRWSGHRRRFQLRQGPSGRRRAAAKVGADTASAPKRSPQVLLDGERISSGRIREALVEGDSRRRQREC